MQGGRPAGRGHVHRRDHPQAANRRAEGAGCRCEEKRREARARRRADQGQGTLVRADGADRRRSLDESHARRILRADHRTAGGERRRGRARPHERHRLRTDRRRVLGERKARAEDPVQSGCGHRVLELLRPGEPPPALVGRQAFGHRPHAVDVRHPDVHAAQGVASAVGSRPPYRAARPPIPPAIAPPAACWRATWRSSSVRRRPAPA